jgi:tetratricopeptide (TPR) repeat protein
VPVNKFTRPFEWNRASAGPAERRLTPLSHHYFAFLSYSHQDAADADWLHGELEKFRVPSSLAGRLTANGVIPKRLTPIFRDRHELAAGDDLATEIREALAASRCLIVLCSPAAAKSRWTNAEIELFKRIHPDGCVIAAIVAGEPFASEIKGREAEECLPEALRHKYDRRGRPTGRRAEPLAADLRETGDGRRLGFLKIVAGILGLGLDDLVQREHLRRQRRWALIASASLIGMLIAIALAVVAIQARDAAREQRRQAESLIEFMVGDLRDKLEPLGQLSALNGVGSRVLDYYSKQDTSQLSDAALLQRSRALSLMGDVAYQSGRLDEAQSLYRQAMAGTAEAVRRSPDDPQRLYDHAQNVFWIGEVARWRGDPGTAAAGYREYRRIAYRLSSLAPDNLKYRMEVYYGEEDVGISLLNQRRYAEASRQFQTALGPIEKLASLDPSNLVYQREVGTVLSWVAEAERAQGNYDSAIAARQRQLALVEGLLGKGANDVQLRRQSAVAHMALGIMLSERLGPGSGLTEHDSAVTEADRLVALEPRSAIWKLTAAQTHTSYARELLALDRIDEAKTQWAIGCRFADSLSASGAGLSRSRGVQTDCLTIEARLQLASGGINAALAAAERALASAKSERNEDPIADRYRVAAAYLMLGDVQQRAGNSRDANASWSAGLAQLPQGVAERPQDMNTHGELLRRLGRGADARPLTTRLAAIGYRSIT